MVKYHAYEEHGPTVVKMPLISLSYVENSYMN